MLQKTTPFPPKFENFQNYYDETDYYQDQTNGFMEDDDEPLLTGYGHLNVSVNFDDITGTLFATVYAARDLNPRLGDGRSGYPNPFVKIYLLPGRV